MTAISQRPARGEPLPPLPPSEPPARWPARGPGRRSRHALAWAVCVLLLATTVTGGVLASRSITREPVPPRPDGVARAADGSIVAIPVGAAARYIPGTSYLVGSDASPADIAESRAWLASGMVPGSTPRERELAERALLDLRLLTDSTGATLAGWRTAWQYVWPRDAGFVVVAFAATGHLSESESILDYLAAVAPSNGQWQARYLPDGSGLAPDCRVMQFDGAGWVPWGVWSWYVASEQSGEAAAKKGGWLNLWPARA